MNLKLRRLGLLLVLAIAWPLSVTALADDTKTVCERDRLARLSDEERQQMRQQLREHWQQMPPDQQQDYKKQRRERWQQLTPEERDRRREDRRRKTENRDRS